MRTLQFATGGRPVANDDFVTLQDRDALLGLPALLAGLGPCVVSGCRVYQTGSVWNVGAGMVWDGANLLDFTGRSNVRLPLMFIPSAVATADERAYQTGGTKTTISEQTMNLVAVDPAASNPLILTVAGAITFWQRVQEKTRKLGTVEYITDTAGYDSTGLGSGTELGWALCNGRNGTVDLRGQFVVGQDPARSDYDTVGKTGGEEQHTLTAAEMPSHRHRMTPTKTDSQLGGGNNDWTRIAAGHPSARPNSAGDNANYTDAQGGGQAHENRPPFYVLAARQWMGL